MKAHFIDTHLLVPRSRSSAEVKVKYQAPISQKMSISVLLRKIGATFYNYEKGDPNKGTYVPF